MSLASLRTTFKVLLGVAGLVFLYWLYREHEDVVGEMVCDMDDIDNDDPGEDLDE